MKYIFFLSSIVLLIGCSSFTLLRSPSANSTEQWKKNEQYSYKVMSDCSSLAKKKLNIDEAKFFTVENINTGRYKSISLKYQKYLYDCMYDNGYRFKPNIGYCDYWRNSYDCLNKEYYSD
ncbi:hypothetical protein P7L95_09795 [Bisgaard Taxon 10/6]|uniref:hypothetical protein n=1 Tax=Exercitatus varius TaxID=67857 RepID=UPI00294AAA73|nr:hypothetical protein [Exercitatus varius]MDG2957034.1 hypothetical protein [Exercitatus varius]MDG2964657.1 hypothetical protein [Exercitatus varius]